MYIVYMRSNGNTGLAAGSGNFENILERPICKEHGSTSGAGGRILVPHNGTDTISLGIVVNRKSRGKIYTTVTTDDREFETKGRAHGGNRAIAL